MIQKKVLMLGGSNFQVPAIQYAKHAGYYVITCDYLPDNPGHKYSDEYYNISTTDLEGILQLATKLQIDGIVAYASDPAAPTAAYVSERLNLPGNPYKSVRILTEKDLFREFLNENNFNVPFAKGYSNFDQVAMEIGLFTFPIMVKPVDSSGSKGVCKVNCIDELEGSFKNALSYSRNGRIVVEEYIDNIGFQLHGDAFVVDGKVVFCYLGDHHYNLDLNPFVPYSTTLPSVHTNFVLLNVESDLQRLINLLNVNQGAFNIEARIDKEGKIYLMEVGPRNGGNLVPQLEKYATGFDMISASIEIAMGNCRFDCTSSKKGYYAYYVLHSKNDGELRKIEISDSLHCNILEKHIFKKTGEQVNAFNGSNATIGILLLKFDSAVEMNEKISNMGKFINIEVI